MVQPGARLWLREAAGRFGRRGRVRSHGDGACRSLGRAAAGSEPGSADRTERQGAYGRRASSRGLSRIAAAAAAVLVACSPQAQAPAQNLANDEQAQAPASEWDAQTGLSEIPLTINSRGKVLRFTVEVAASPQQQERGLMFRKSLAPDRGMIFPYTPPQHVAFWMKNTLIPLDMVFIRKDGTIARIATAKPLDQTPVPSGEPVVAVLEIAGGRAAQLGIKAGDVARW